MPNLWKIGKKCNGNILWACFGLLTLAAGVVYFVWSVHEFSGYEKNIKNPGNGSQLLGDEEVKKDGEKFSIRFEF